MTQVRKHLNQSQVLPWTERRCGLLPGLSYENTFEGKRYIALLIQELRQSHIRRKVLTASNPFEEPVTSLLVFGSQLLALSEDGGRLLIWDTHDGSEGTHAPSMRICLT